MAILMARNRRALYRPVRAIAGVAIAVLFVLTAGGQNSEAGEQEFSEYDIKAAYLINFAKYVEWPEEAFAEPDSPFKIGILGENPFGDTLAQLARKHTLGEHKMEVSQSEDASEMAECHMVFVAAPKPPGTSPDLSAFADKPILTVGEQEGFAEDGGIINFVIQKTKVKFEISLKEANRISLKISPRLLKLATTVHE